MAATAASLHRYPVKSMLGEDVASAAITEQGLLGDRAFALWDTVTGKMASAKNPRVWGNLLDFRASYTEPPTSSGDGLPPVSVTMPDGSDVRSDDPDVDRILSESVGRAVTLTRSGASGMLVEQYHPDLEDLNPDGHRDEVTDFTAASLAPGTFCDLLPLHLLTTATLRWFEELYPEGRWEVARFRPNVVIDVESSPDGCPENVWPGHDALLGDEVRLNLVVPVPRCVMTTLAQGDLPKDNRILQTAVRHNRLEVAGFGHYPCVGVYAGVSAGGTVRRGDDFRLV